YHRQPRSKLIPYSTLFRSVGAVSYLERDPLPGFLIRKKRKEHGRHKQIEGIDENKPWRVVIVDEVCTTGDSTFEAIELAENQGRSEEHTSELQSRGHLVCR